MNGKFKETAWGIIEALVIDPENGKAGEGFAESQVRLARLQIELDEETADRTVASLDLMIVAIEDLTDAVKSHGNVKVENYTRPMYDAPPRVGCECIDCGCPVHEGGLICDKKASETLFRVDQEDRSGTRFCDPCGHDAMESGLFRTQDDTIDESLGDA